MDFSIHVFYFSSAVMDVSYIMWFRGASGIVKPVQPVLQTLVPLVAPLGKVSMFAVVFMNADGATWTGAKVVIIRVH